jgi:hypothetical protein
VKDCEKIVERRGEKLNRERSSNDRKEIVESFRRKTIKRLGREGKKNRKKNV